MLHRLALWMHVDDTSMDCLVFALANRKGVVLNGAWMVPVSAVFGDFLAYAANVAPRYLSAMIVGKLTAGVLALLAVGFAMRRK